MCIIFINTFGIPVMFGSAGNEGRVLAPLGDSEGVPKSNPRGQ